jgi:uncharacterized protein (DUF1015 family)
MARISPFRALRYDPSRVRLPEVVTQPYDKITSDMQERYHAASPHNLVRIILGKPKPGDNAGQNVYARAAGHFREWRNQGVLLQDAQPAIYPYFQRFTAPDTGLDKERRGFIALGRLEDYSANVIYRHEQTLSKPKADRLELLRATRAHFGQIFVLYSDPAGELDTLVTCASQPEIEVEDEYKVLHRVWKIADPGAIALIADKMKEKKLIIADGHHRYETALAYRDERQAMAASIGAGGVSRDSSPAPRATQDAAYEMAMMTFVNMDSPGLVILPTHRVVHGLDGFSAERFRTSAKAFFSVEEVDANIGPERAMGILRQAGQVGTAILAVTGDRAFLLDRPSGNGSGLFEGMSLRQQSLDVVQLHRVILHGILGLSDESVRDQQNISYVRDAGEALSRVRQGSANVAFLMNAARMRQVRDIAFSGEVLPQKSTDFYPKLLSGLTIYALE